MAAQSSLVVEDVPAQPLRGPRMARSRRDLLGSVRRKEGWSGQNAPYRSDGLVTKFGPMWGYRWARALGAKIDGSKESEPPESILRYGMESPAR